jgi:NDP-sugar pyrophosphorylase family protein
MKHLVSWEQTIAYPYFKSSTNYFEIINSIKEIIYLIIAHLDEDYLCYQQDIYIHKSAIIEDNVILKPPLIIGAGTMIKSFAILKGNCIIGDQVVIGYHVEIKNSILCNEVKIAHLSYVGDSLLGYRVHLGGGVIISNLRLDQKNIIVTYQDKKYDTSMRKLGAIIGDEVEIGANSVINPGSIIEKKQIILPLSNIKGHIQ